MRRFVIVVAAGLFLSGCGAAGGESPATDIRPTVAESTSAPSAAPSAAESTAQRSGTSSYPLTAGGSSGGPPTDLTDMTTSAPAASTSTGPATAHAAGTPSTSTLPPPKNPTPVSAATAANETVALLATLAVKGRAPKTGYDRALFGPAWTDDVTVDGGHNGCDTRNDILRRDLTDLTIKPDSHGCTVLTGVLHDPYTGKTIDFERGQATSGAVQIDHVVALMDAWQKGAQQLSTTERRNLANDPLNLQAVDSPTNAQKGAGDAATWLPPNKSYRCTYVSRQVEVKARYRLWVTQAEKEAIARVLATCGASPASPAAPAAPQVAKSTATSSKPPMTTSSPKPPPATTSKPPATKPKPPPATSAKPPAQPKPGACHPLSAAGNCYKAGQICAKKDHGGSGIDGSGRAIRCVDDNGTWRWKAA